MPFSFFPPPFFFSFRLFFVFPLRFAVFRVPFLDLFSFVFVLSSCRFPFDYGIAFFASTFASLLSLRILSFCYVVSALHPPPALLASLKYACSPCVLSSFFLAWLMSTYLYLFFSSFPFSISIWTSFLFSSCPHLVGTMLSPRLRFLLRLV